MHFEETSKSEKKRLTQITMLQQNLTIKNISLLFLLFISCNQKQDTSWDKKDLAAEIHQSFQKMTDYAVSTVELIRVEDYKYVGYVLLKKDESKVWIEVYIDKDNPKVYLWKMTEPNATMIKDAVNKNLELPRIQQY